MNQSRNSPVIRSAPGQVWNQSSSSTSNSGSIYGFRRDHQPIEQKKTSFFGLIVRVLTCKGDIAHVDEGHPQPATVPYSNPASLKSSKKHDSASSTPSVASNGQQGSNGLSFEDIRKATGDFSTSNIIGEGGFGTVYKGTLKNGSIIAIKRVKKETYDRGTPVEFKNEILTFSKIEHLNLVRFYGYIEHGDERIILVEYVSNGTLRDHLDGKCGSGLETGERLDIMIDVAHAITYLHTYTDLPIIHRDIKSSNILITDKLRAKVADFGFARIRVEDPTATHISTQVKGTAGYLDPEYLSTYQLTDRSDVYSFGVLLVELVTGRLPIELSKAPNERLTTKWAMQRLKGGEVVLAMDPKLRRNPASMMVVEKVLRLARQCLAPTRQLRPSMKRCAEILWRIRKDFHEHKDVMAAAIHSVQVPQMDARKNRREFFGIEDSNNQRFQSA
ncbi:calmodulin-binding receptor-like cytoplasmic kinase 2 [Cynara cardunculus var. scolymus]|uniref:calmodulin-binding receptor-like cytoplasmic kinase 2 n=1 Tax=Cynara cardunculus var. scolymus TaxID=59895 RepID=UPI000D6290A6|nr:calmodulin-binding receptor-like cytoplasmic kinase 2 [Cynara cardunculus var. scolymus]